MPRLTLTFLITLPALALLVTGCSLGYYAQAVSGHLSLTSGARPIDEVLADPNTSPEVAAKLRTARTARAFASAELGLPDNDSYRRYAEVQRSHVVWNVVATPEFSLTPKSWCFAFSGCVNYKGYFSREQAEQQAAELARSGYDVQVSGSQAYSTLGWTDDPLLSTMIARPDVDLASVIFHELAHQKLYVKNDTAFNESFAETVAREGVRRWLQANDRADELTAFKRREDRRQQFDALLLETRRQLAAVYREPGDAPAKRAAKRQVFEQLKHAYAELKDQWGGYGGYDGWMNRPLNNAHLSLVATYNDLIPAFEALLQREGGDLTRFYSAAKGLAGQPPATRHAELKSLLPKPTLAEGKQAAANAAP